MGTLAQKIYTNPLDIAEIRNRFPALHQKVNNYPLAYFDNAATTQKPNSVIEALVHYYKSYNANIHRGIHTLAEKATAAFENTRKRGQKFVNAASEKEIIFTKGTTEGLNLVASTYGRQKVKEGDEILISAMEHHSNIVPWQILCEEKGAKLKVIPITDSGEISIGKYRELLSENTKIVATNYASNSLGTINPIKEMASLAHQVGAAFVVDGAQSAAHLDLDVQDLDVDFFALSAHKMYGPTGAGILYGKERLLEEMPPYQGGGEMIKEVTFEKTLYNDIPYKFEAGTPNIGDVVAFKLAMDFLDDLGKANIAAYENQIIDHCNLKLSQIDGYRPIGTAEKKVSVQSFIIEGIHHFDIGVMLDARGVAVRTGHHCTQPLMDRLGLEGTVRASFAVYNTREEVDQMAEALGKIVKTIRK